MNYALLIIWIVSLFVVWNIKGAFFKTVENQSRLFIYYTLGTAIIFLIWKGEYFISNEYLANITTELGGIAVTVFFLDNITRYISKKNENLYRKLALKACRTPIGRYCAYWISIYEEDLTLRRVPPLESQDLREFFLSEHFHQRVCALNFNLLIDPGLTFGEYYASRMKQCQDHFQSILIKYAPRLDEKDLRLLEYFGGDSNVFIVFEITKAQTSIKFTIRQNIAPAVPPGRRFVNEFMRVDKSSFHKHFHKLLDLIDAYNDAVDDEADKLNLSSLTKLVDTPDLLKTRW